MPSVYGSRCVPLSHGRRAKGGRAADEARAQGKHFTLPALLQNPALAAQLQDGAVAIFRLAVEDYHRFHLPVDAIVGESRSVPGAYFVRRAPSSSASRGSPAHSHSRCSQTVNSMVVRDKHFDVFTENKRDGASPPLPSPLASSSLSDFPLGLARSDDPPRPAPAHRSSPPRRLRPGRRAARRFDQAHGARG